MSKYLGDFEKNDTISFKFTTYRPSTGAPFTLAGTPQVRVYKSNDPVEVDTGVTLSVDFDTKTGLNHVQIVTSDSWYDDPGQYEVVITQGTVDSVSVANACVGRFTIGLNADAVWDEPYESHIASGSFGKLMDLLRKSNLVTDGSASAAGTKMTMPITGDASGKANDFWRGQTLLFVGGGLGTLTGQSTVIAASTSTTITFDSPVSADVPSGAEFVILPIHVHPVDEIGQAVLDKRIGESGMMNYVSAVSTASNATFTGVNYFKAGDSVSFLTAPPTGFALGTKYTVKSASLTPTTFQLTTGAEGSAAITPTSSTTSTLIPRDERTVRSAMQYLRNKIDVSTGTLKVYAEDDVAESWSASTTTNSSAQPIVTFDPVD